MLESKIYNYDLTVVIPVYRNASMLVSLIDRIHSTLDEINVSHRILAVDDASPDNSWEILNQISLNDIHLGAVRLESNRGQHNALLTGLSLCTSPWIAIMDADLQDPPEVLSQLYKKAKESDATVFAERYGKYENGYRLLASRIHKTILYWLTGVPKSCGTFFVTSAETVKTMLGHTNKTPQVVVMVAYASIKLETVAFKRETRPSGESSYTLQTLFKAAFHAYKNVFYYWVSRMKQASTLPIPIATLEDQLGWVSKFNKNNK